MNEDSNKSFVNSNRNQIIKSNVSAATPFTINRYRSKPSCFHFYWFLFFNSSINRQMNVETQTIACSLARCDTLFERKQEGKRKTIITTTAHSPIPLPYMRVRQIIQRKLNSDFLNKIFPSNFLFGNYTFIFVCTLFVFCRKNLDLFVSYILDEKEWNQKSKHFYCSIFSSAFFAHFSCFLPPFCDGIVITFVTKIEKGCMSAGTKLKLERRSSGI